MQVSIFLCKGNKATIFAPVEVLMERFRRKVGVPQLVWEDWKKESCQFTNLLKVLPANDRIRFQKRAAKLLNKQLQLKKVNMEILP
jgi:hypothetical protein